MTDTTEMVPKADLDALAAERDTFKTKYEELKTSHGETLTALQSVEAERDSAAARTTGLQESMTEALMAPLVGRLLDPVVADKLPKPTFDEATGKLSGEWHSEVETWMDEHKVLLKPTETPATPTTPTTPERPSTPTPGDGNPTRTQGYWIDILHKDPEQFRRRFKEYQGDKKAGGW